MTTKEKIIEQSLKLFSQKGYAAVSVRDIARAVGIKESSLYNHFKGKQAIFDTIVNTCFERMGRYYREALPPSVQEADGTAFAAQVREQIYSVFTPFFEDGDNVMFRKLLILSQFDDNKCKVLYRQLYRDYPIRQLSRIFAQLMEAGRFRSGDAMTVARDYYGAVFMLVHTCDSMEEAGPLLDRHYEYFIGRGQG